MGNKEIAYIEITLERPEDKPETMANVDRIEKVESFDANGNSIKEYPELSYDGTEFPEGSDICKYVSEELNVPTSKIIFND